MISEHHTFSEKSQIDNFMRDMASRKIGDMNVLTTHPIIDKTVYSMVTTLYKASESVYILQTKVLDSPCSSMHNENNFAGAFV